MYGYLSIGTRTTLPNSLRIRSFIKPAVMWTLLTELPQMCIHGDVSTVHCLRLSVFTTRFSVIYSQLEWGVSFGVCCPVNLVATGDLPDFYQLRAINPRGCGYFGRDRQWPGIVYGMRSK